MPSDILKHYGTKRHSGRYPWGSGKDPYQSAQGFIAERDKLKAQGMSEVDIAKAWGMSTTEYRALNSIARAEKKAGDISRASRLKDAGLPNTEIGRRMGLNESSVRELLKPNASYRKDEITRVKDILADEVKQKKFIEYGLGVEQNLQCSSTSLKTAV